MGKDNRRGEISLMVRGLRGATTATENTPEAISVATHELMETIVQVNQLEIEQVASVMLTMTPDLNASFPAKAVRSIDGWQWVPLICTPEIAVPGSLPLCIRVLIHINTDKSQQELMHVYLRRAEVLRPDIASVANSGV